VRRFRGSIAALETFTMNSDQTRQRAERNFRKEERDRDGRKAMSEYEAQARATRQKTARLKALRLAKEAEDAKEAEETKEPKEAQKQKPKGGR
jgi:hypothetical protein